MIMPGSQWKIQKGLAVPLTRKQQNPTREIESSQSAAGIKPDIQLKTQVTHFSIERMEMETNIF